MTFQCIKCKKIFKREYHLTRYRTRNSVVKKIYSDTDTLKKHFIFYKCL